VRGARLRRRPARALLAAALLAPGVWGCGPDREEPAEARPSILLFVIDTLRADAVGAYGAPEGVTPNLDALAGRGLRFANAFASAPWTLPSHASLLFGLGVEEHHLGLGGRAILAPQWESLADRLSAVGYETVGFAENPLVSAPFGLTRGFERFEARSVEELLADFRGRADAARFDVVGRVGRWARDREGRRPFLLFVNVLDPHLPYTVRGDDRFLPEGVSSAEAAEVSQEPDRICDALPPPEELAILRGLYLGDVAAADAKLGAVVRAAREAGRGGRLVTVVTSDHGEHLGEHGLLDHQFTLRHEALHVPLVVEGLDAEPAVVDEAVSLSQLAAAALRWTGVEPAGAPDPSALPGPPGGAGPGVIAAYDDTPPADWPDAVPLPGVDRMDATRRACGEEDRVFGSMLSLIRPPYKLTWYERYPPELHDLRWDAAERSNLIDVLPEIAAPLQAKLRALLAEADPFRAHDTPTDPEVLERLRAMGYAE
jgi:arylsulfatase A-like enzyme